MNAILIDMSGRSLMVCSVSVTKVGKSNDLVLRKGVDLGRLDALISSNGRGFYDESCGLIITTTEYKAEESAGYTEVVGQIRPNASIQAVCNCLGQKKLALAAPKIPVIFFGVGKWRIHRAETHDNLNRETAEAAKVGLNVLARARGLVAIVEGQSNKTSGFAVGGRPDWDDRRGGIDTIHGLKGASDGLMTDGEWKSIPQEHQKWLLNFMD